MDPSYDEFKTLHIDSIDQRVMLLEKLVDPDLLLLVTISFRSDDEMLEHSTNILRISIKRVAKNDTSGIFEDVRVHSIDLQDDFCKTVQRLNSTHIILFCIKRTVIVRVCEHAIELLHKFNHIPNSNQIHRLDAHRFAMQLGNTISIFHTNTCKLIKVISAPVPYYTYQLYVQAGLNTSTLLTTFAGKLMIENKGSLVLLSPSSGAMELVLNLTNSIETSGTVLSSHAPFSGHHSSQSMLSQMNQPKFAKLLVLSNKFAVRYEYVDRSIVLSVFSLTQTKNQIRDNYIPKQKDNSFKIFDKKKEQAYFDYQNIPIEKLAEEWKVIIKMQVKILHCGHFTSKNNHYLYVVSVGETMATECRFYRILHSKKQDEQVPIKQPKNQFLLLSKEKPVSHFQHQQKKQQEQQFNNNNNKKETLNELRESETYSFPEINSKYSYSTCIEFHDSEIYFFIVFEFPNKRQIYVNKLFTR